MISKKKWSSKCKSNEQTNVACLFVVDRTPYLLEESSQDIVRREKRRQKEALDGLVCGELRRQSRFVDNGGGESCLSAVLVLVLENTLKTRFWKTTY